MNRKRPRQLGKKHQGLNAEGRKKAPAPGSPSRRPEGAASKHSGSGKPTGGKPGARKGPAAAGSAGGSSWGAPGRKGPAKPASGGKRFGSGPQRSGSAGGSSGSRFAGHGKSEGRSAARYGDAARQEPKPRFAPPARDGRPALSKGTARSTTPRPGTANARQVWGHTAPPSRARLEELLGKHGVNLPGPVLDKVWQYHGILRRNNGDLDLTRLIGFETIVQRHYADCLILHKMMKGKWPSPLVDIGTGAGFPGLMIKIASPETEMILSEPRNVRVDYLNDTIAELGLKNISVFGHKFTSKSFQTPVRGVITRAFEPIAKTLPRLQYSLQAGGLAMFMKGPGVDEELAGPIPSNYRLVRDERYRIPATTLDRAFVVFERIA